MRLLSTAPTLSEKEIFDTLRSIGQANLFNHWRALTSSQRENLREQIAYLDIDLFSRQQKHLNQPQELSFPIHPFKDHFSSGNRNDHKWGEKLMQGGKCACVVLAGGQGSRLCCQRPKGCYPISLVRKKTLFQLVAEKVKAASAQAKSALQLAIMTSPLNHDETENFFIEQAFFGLDPHQVTFFYQKIWPLLNFEGNLFLQESDQIAWGPNGNGDIFRALHEGGIVHKWEAEGIEMINVLPIDNPLALPFDPELFGFHARNQCEVTIKASFLSDPQEKVGILATVDNKLTVVEYTELCQKQRDQKAMANLGLYCFSLPFIRKMKTATLPLHRVKKAVNIKGEAAPAWKFEKFMFDAFPLASSCKALVYPRELCFAPLKNLQGRDSIGTVQAALLSLDRHVYFDATGIEAPSGQVFELAPEFYYPTEMFLKKWKGKFLRCQPYIT